MPKYYNRVTSWAQVAISLLRAWSGTRCARTQCDWYMTPGHEMLSLVVSQTRGWLFYV